jgi:hypothetical protein
MTVLLRSKMGVSTGCATNNPAQPQKTYKYHFKPWLVIVTVIDFVMRYVHEIGKYEV